MPFRTRTPLGRWLCVCVCVCVYVRLPSFFYSFFFSFFLQKFVRETLIDWTEPGSVRVQFFNRTVCRSIFPRFDSPRGSTFPVSLRLLRSGVSVVTSHGPRSPGNRYDARREAWKARTHPTRLPSNTRGGIYRYLCVNAYILLGHGGNNHATIHRLCLIRTWTFRPFLFLKRNVPYVHKICNLHIKSTPKIQGGPIF